MGLCGECWKQYQAWLDYRIVEPIQIAPVGNRVQDVRHRQESRARRWRETIRSQQALIVDVCKHHHHKEQG